MVYQTNASSLAALDAEAAKDGKRSDRAQDERSTEAGRICLAEVPEESLMDGLYDHGSEHSRPHLVPGEGENSFCVSIRCIPIRSKGR